MNPEISKPYSIFLSPPARFDGQTLILTSDIDPFELRRAALFWDDLVWPRSQIMNLLSSSDEKRLEAANVLRRPQCGTEFLDLAKYFDVNTGAELSRMEGAPHTQGNFIISGPEAYLWVKEHVNEFRKMDADQSRRYLMATGENSLYLEPRFFPPDRGARLVLARAIPVPDREMPIDEVLEFKRRRQAEILDLNDKLDEFYRYISLSDHPEAELLRLLDVIDRRCLNVYNAAKESKWEFRMTDWDISVPVSIEAIEGGVNRVLTWFSAGLALGGLPLGLLTGAIGVGVSFVSVERGIGIVRKEPSSDPFRVALSIKNELVR